MRLCCVNSLITTGPRWSRDSSCVLELYHAALQNAETVSWRTAGHVADMQHSRCDSGVTCGWIIGESKLGDVLVSWTLQTLWKVWSLNFESLNVFIVIVQVQRNFDAVLKVHVKKDKEL